MARMDEAGITTPTDITSIIKNRFNIKLSPGILYPVLYKLERDGIINRLPKRIKQIYVLTGKGKKTIRYFKNMPVIEKKIEKIVQ